VRWPRAGPQAGKKRLCCLFQRTEADRPLQFTYFGKEQSVKGNSLLRAAVALLAAAVGMALAAE